jgi:hypothetical protein
MIASKGYSMSQEKIEKTSSLIKQVISEKGIDLNEVSELFGQDNKDTFESGPIFVPGEVYTEHKLPTSQQNNKTQVLDKSENDKDNDKEFSYLLEKNSEKKLIEALRNVYPGLGTGYKIGDIDLKFHGGVISIIAAPTSHGKTSALINFTLGILENNQNISAYFFTYEESDASILSLFLNTFIDETLSKNNRESIATYFRDDNIQFIYQDKHDLFIQSKNKFFGDLIDNGRLKIVYSDMTTDKLIEAIRYLKKNSNIGLICIDYMQLLKLNTKGSRQEELKEICLMLKDCAIETGLPIVLAAQFNRTVVTEADLSSVNIGEAGDIERIASLIIGMYNRNFILHKDGNKDKDGNKIDKESTIYFEILKGRGIGNGHNTVIGFDGNAGKLQRALESKENHNSTTKQAETIQLNENPF